MISTKILYLIINVITITLSYSIVITLVGAFKAWVAKKLGDDTAESMGLMTLNPLAHVDYIGLLSLYLIGIGWGRQIPINPSYITGRWKRLKTLFAYSVDVIAYFMLAFLGMVLLSLIFGSHMIQLSYKMVVCTEYLSQPYIQQACPTIATEGLLFSYILIVAIYACALFGSYDFIRMLVIFCMQLFERRIYTKDLFDERSVYINAITLVVAVFLLFRIKFFIITSIAIVSFAMAHLFGL